MKYPTIFHLISTEFEKAEIPHVLIGGFAVNYYGVTRQTVFMDIINLLRMNKVNVRTGQFRKLCLKYGTKKLYRKVLKCGV